MKSRLVVTSVIILFPCLMTPAEEIDWGLDLTLRGEAFDTPSADRSLDDEYQLGLFRLRLDADWQRDEWTVHGVAQIAGVTGVPDGGAFGIGPVYRVANEGVTSPAAADLIELSAEYDADQWWLRLGRMRYADGAEVMTGIAHLDQVKRGRIAERLIGNWDWVSSGRRFEGVVAGWGDDTLHIEGLWLRPLSGGVNVESAYSSLDELDLFGSSLTLRHGSVIPAAELRGFYYLYDDDRDGALAAAGGSVKIETVGAHLLVGDNRWDLLGWLARQYGDWGESEHDAYAFIFEGGYVFESAIVVSVRTGYAVASGGAGETHETFFNILPTNHKWYGSMDYSAFQNLSDLYVMVSATGTRGWQIDLEAHSFRLEDQADAWYGGSGAFNDRVFGYASREVEGGFTDDSIGTEVDLRLSVPFPGPVRVSLGASYFDGGRAASQLLAHDSSGSWFLLQVAWSR